MIAMPGRGAPETGRTVLFGGVKSGINELEFDMVKTDNRDAEKCFVGCKGVLVMERNMREEIEREETWRDYIDEAGGQSRVMLDQTLIWE